MYTQKDNTTVSVVENIEKTIIRRQILGGLISWKKMAYEEKIGQDLFIATTEKFDDIYLNGKKLRR